MFIKLLEPLADYSSYTDNELLEALRRDDEKAFAALFQRYWEKVHEMAYARVRSRQVTEEIVQELFISLWDKRASLSINNMPAYLFTAVKYKSLNYIDSRLVFEKYWEYYRQFVPQQEDSTALAVEFNELMGVFEAGMEDLPEKSKRVFRLNHIEGHSIPEIANLLNLSEKAIQYHLTQSVKKLRLHLKNFIFSLCMFLISLFS